MANRLLGARDASPVGKRYASTFANDNYSSRELGQQECKQTYYFNILVEFFEYHNAQACPHNANPAEWMLAAIGASPGSTSEVD